MDADPKEAYQAADALDAMLAKRGGFSSQLKFSDLQKLRVIVKRVHLKHYPAEFLTDYEADKLIDKFAPETWTYLLHKHQALVS